MKFGIIGAGDIAVWMARTLAPMPEAETYAIAARDLERAEDFAEKYGFEKAYGSYEELVSDPEVEVVYIATPHSHHFEHAKLAIEHEKHVLCEKAFTMNAPQAEELFRLAKEHQVLITEAIWTRYMPSRRIINELLLEKVIGDVKTLTANLSYRICQNERILRPELAGGALLDITIYPLNIDIFDPSHHLVRHIDLPEQNTGYEYEVLEVIDCVRKGGMECPSMPHEETLRVLRIMDGIRKEWGLVYPQEKK